MSIMGCNEFSQQLESWLDGIHPPDAEAHLRGCRACQGLVSDMDTIQSLAHSWEIAEPAEPPARVWASLRLRLEAEGLIHGYAPELAPAVAENQIGGNLEHRSTWFETIFAGMARPALAGAYLVALVAVGFAVSGSGIQRGPAQHWTEVTQNATTPLQSELDTVEHSVASLDAADPVVTASLDKNLAIVDKYIVLCEKSVREEPENEIARDYLFDAYQQKADLLAQLTEDGDGR